MKNTSTTTVAKSPEAPSLESNFEQLYLKKDYKGAANFLLQNKQQLNSGIFHYNLGTVYSKMGDLAAARFHLEKAVKEGYVNTSTLNNLAVVKTQLQVDDISTSPDWQDQLMNSFLSFPISAYVTVTLAIVMIGLILIRTKTVVKKFTMALIFLLALVPVVFAFTYLDKVNYAVAFKDISLYEGPSKIFQEKGKVRAGSKVILGEFKEGWFYVKYPISLAGWVNKDQLGLY